MRHMRRAFTLIELLVVVGVITLLLSILLPVINRVIEQARIAKCQSNQHEVFTALHTFAVDNGFICPGSCGVVPAGGPLTVPYCGAGQLISNADSLPQSTLELTSRSVLLSLHYLPTSAVFHCPQQDSVAGLELGFTATTATFHYVFNQYFVGDKQCAPNGVPVAGNFTPQYSTAFPDVTSPITLNRAENIATRCVVITEDGMGYTTAATVPGIVQDSTQEFLASTNVTYVHATPWHAVRQHKTSDALPYIIADAVTCTYVDGHTEMVYVHLMDGSVNYTVPSDNGRPAGQNVSTTGLPR